MQIYFSLTYIPAPHTIYEGVYKLEPNKYIEYSIDDKKFSIQEPLGTKRPGESTWKVLVALEHDSDGESKTDYLDVQFSQVWKEAIFAGIVAAITRSYFTDYVAPYLLSIFASVLFIFNVSAL